MVDRKAARVLAQRRLAASRERWRHDPVAYFAERLRVTLTAEQAAVVRDVAITGRVSWRSGQKVGKSEVLAGLALWWAETRERALVVLTSGNASQVKVILWAALRRLYKRARDIGGRLALDPATGLSFEDGRLVVGLTASEPERLAGYSGAELLFLVDEASGFSDELLETIIGNTGGGGAVVFTGNPTRSIGLFARTHRERLPGWALHHTSSRSSPNVVAGRVVVPGLATADWVRFMEDTFGAESAAVAVRVDGNFAAEGADQVIGLALVEAALARWSPAGADAAYATLRIGLDVARFGDDETVLQARRGPYAYQAIGLRGLSTMEVAQRATEYARQLGRPGETPVIAVDSAGLGAGVVDALNAAGGHYTVEAINAGEASRHPDRFKNKRAELHWCVRQWLMSGGALPPDDRRDGELLAARYSTDAALRVVVRSKDEVKRLLKRSPDRADALMLACADESPIEGAESRRFVIPAQPAYVPRQWEGQPQFRLPPLPGDFVRPEDRRPVWRPGLGLGSPFTRKHGW